MIEKIEGIETRFNTVNEELCSPEVIADMEKYTALMKEQKRLEPIVEKFKEYKRAKATADEASQMLEEGGLDKEMKELAFEELKTAKEEMETCNEALKILLLPRDENDDKNVIVEIRGGAGGEESAPFAGTLYRMYTM